MGTESRINISEISEGMELFVLKKEIIQENINLYAKASKDFNPIHIDEEFAKGTPLGGTIAHGMLILAYVSQMMTANFGHAWINHGKLNVKFKSPARPGDILVIGGSIKKVVPTEGQNSVKCNIFCQNQENEIVISGDALVDC